jgi:hypothetical protein
MGRIKQGEVDDYAHIMRTNITEKFIRTVAQLMERCRRCVRRRRWMPLREATMRRIGCLD